MREKEVVYEFAGFRLNPAEKLLTRDLERIQLRPKTFALLVELVSQPGKLFEKGELLEKIWDDAVVEEGNLNRTVSELRKILGDPKENPKLIETVPRVGYRFIAEVTTIGDESETAEPLPSAVTPTQRKTRPWVLFWLAAVAGILIIGVVLALLFFSRRDGALNEFGELRLTNNPLDENSVVWFTNEELRFNEVPKNGRAVVKKIGVDGTGLADSVRVSPDGKYTVILDENDSKILYLAAADGTSRRRLPFLFGNADWSRVSSEIVVQFFPDGKRDASDLAIINLDTLEWRNLTNSPTFDADPAFSPDAKQIAFTSTRDGNAELYMMDRDGGNVRRMTTSPAWESFPAFSPDGTQLSYNSDRDHELNNIYIQDLDGSGRERALPRGDWRNFTGNGFWSPDGTRIAYSSDRRENEDVFVRAAELEAPREILADSGADLLAPYLSRDGTKLIFVAKVAKDKFEIRVQDRASGKINVVRTLRDQTRLSATADGKTILFQEKIGDNTEICAIDSAGGNFRNLTNSGAFDAAAEFSPDGNRIAFISNRRGRSAFEIFVMNADGSDQRPVADNEMTGTSISPNWTLDGRRIIFANDRDGGGNGNFELFIIDDSGGEATRMINNPRAADDSPSLSYADGRIVFRSLSRGNSEIYVTGKDMSILRLTRNLAEDREPIWDERNSKVIFSSDRGGRFALYEMTP